MGIFAATTKWVTLSRIAHTKLKKDLPILLHCTDKRNLTLNPKYNFNHNIVFNSKPRL